MSYEKLKTQLKNGSFSQLIHFFGEETYLKYHYLDRCKESILTVCPEFNLSVFEGGINANDLYTACQTPPMMSDKKLVLLKNTGIFNLSSAAKDSFSKVFEDIPEYVHIFFDEENFDRRSALYKAFTAAGGMSVNFEYRTPGDIRAWVNKMLSGAKMQIESSALDLFLDAAGVSMNNVKSQLDKLMALCCETKKITAQDVEKIISKDPKTREYNLTDALLERNPSKTFEALLTLEQMKYEPVKLLYVIVSSFLSAHRARVLLSEGKSASEVATLLKMPTPFLAKKAVNFASKSTEGYLECAISNLRVADYKIKLGIIEPFTCIKLVCSMILEQKEFV